MRSWFRTEDTLAVILGFLMVTLSMGVVKGVDLLGWVVQAKVWADPALAIVPVSKAYANLGGLGSFALTYAVLVLLLSSGAWFLGERPTRFAVRFVVLFPIAYFCWVLGHYVTIAATPDKLKAFEGATWSLGLTGEAGYLVALIAGLLLGNLSPRIAAWFAPAARSELYIKTAIVILGAALGAKAAEASGIASAILFRGFAAIVEAYLIYWALVYLVARTIFGFSREWAAPLAAGISICGVSAAITTGAAIRARPVVPIMVSSLVVVFSVIEMLVLPAAAKYFLADEPMVAAAWMGLAVKTDGAAVSSGAITASMVLPDSKNGQEWMLLTTSTVKVFIDMFIGIWAILLAAIWATKIDRKPGEGSRGVPFADIWQRFPKFVFGYMATFAGFLALGLSMPEQVKTLKFGTTEAEQMRRIFFVLTFFAIGLSANFRRLWAEGLGKLALVYVVSLFGFVIWIGLVISFLFFGGVQPPAATLTGN
ncbi:MAG: YeiH family protein [Bacteroidales bacterium]|nr:YeiH family protein [Bacteroidales bacterium]